MCRLLVNTYKIPGATNLYRYDIECPPNEWSVEFKNKEYVYDEECEDLQIKNRIGAFFFFDNSVAAYQTSCLAAQKNGCDNIWLTETSIIREIQLLDFSHFENITSILLAFDELGFDVLTDKFHKFESLGACKNLSQLRPLVNQLRHLRDISQKSDKDICEISKLAGEIGSFFSWKS